MTGEEEKLAILGLDADRAWKILDAAHRAMPGCEHNQHWQASITIAKEEHRAALKARDRQLRKMARLDDEGTAKDI